MRNAAWLAFGMVLCYCIAQSQPPGPTPGKAAQKDKNNTVSKQAVASNDQGDSGALSAAIDKLTSEIASWKKQESDQQGKADASAERWAIGSAAVSSLATVAIAILAFFQWRAMDRQRRAMDAQAEYMRSGLTETTKAADAATISANTARDTLFLTERADVLIAGIHISTADQLMPHSVVGLSFQNFGRTRAIGLRPSFWMGVEGVANGLNQNSITSSLLGAGDHLLIPFPPIHTCVTMETFAGIQSGKEKLVFRGELIYDDIFGHSHRTTCSGVYNHRTSGFYVERNEAE